jgi:hypothetical protein
MSIDELKTLSDSWSWSRGRLSLLGLAAMSLWNDNRLHIGISLKRMAFRSFCSPRQISAIDRGILLVATADAHCYAIDAHMRMATDPERDAIWKCIKGYSASQLACVLDMHPDEASACCLHIW